MRATLEALQAQVKQKVFVIPSVLVQVSDLTKKALMHCFIGEIN
ncbi:hypothetical protein MGP2080_00750 [marine gamma proteobacterium HTCC2080]|jgi:hypothetical protein|nr:hypothetical protein MGP2080_00750 [marine gamma proteobacterium HTCC2080]